MGNAQSNAFKKLSKELLPPSWKCFNDDEERHQFIYAVMAVASHNGLKNLEDYDFKLLYSRREHQDDRFVARVVAVKDGAIQAKIEPEADGADQKEAFMALKKDIEIQLDRILQAVPSGPSSSRSATAKGPRSGGPDAPPAYTNSKGATGDQKKG